MSLAVSITKRERKRQLRSGTTVVQTRYVVNFQEPQTGQRKQLFFERHRDAVAKRTEILASVVTGSYATPRTASPTVAEVVQRWLESRRNQVKAGTWRSYQQAVGYVIGPLLVGTKLQRHAYARTGVKPASGDLIEMLGAVRVADARAP